ncbi:hypothetical protein EDC30_101518 [Paucimonas lemoignei]|uniref:Lipoprotein n=1 Tax=Paucimonas lemoignei TaxID=29443 RepID=A0A4R3I1Y1_PAULE|nr:hypothetical protein [Paucimonas lemoignei]TCS39562.1 hypothetical protein EDC30_101518 [Paucimonas lemoignei]
MKMTFGKLGFALLLSVSMAGAMAGPAQDWQSEDSARVERQMEWARASQARRGDGGGYPDYDRRGGNDGRGGYDGRNGRDDQFRNGQQQGGYWQAPPDDGRRGGRMSPEERRELRRQIDEAGRNIYAPGRR